MYTETIDLTLGGNEYTAPVDFEYAAPEEGSATSPDIQEEVTIYKISLEVADNIWATLDDEYTDFAKEQVLDWIHDKQEQANLDKAETYTERRMREMENETWRP